jgi:hypothetical protein
LSFPFLRNCKLLFTELKGVRVILYRIRVSKRKIDLLTLESYDSVKKEVLKGWKS